MLGKGGRVGGVGRKEGRGKTRGKEGREEGRLEGKKEENLFQLVPSQ